MEKIAWERDDLSFMFVDPTEPIIKQNFIWVLSRGASGGLICTPVQLQIFSWSINFYVIF